MQLDAIITRLKLVNDEIPATVIDTVSQSLTVYATPPVFFATHERTDYPILYPVHAGATETGVASEDYERLYRFDVELLIDSVDFASLASDDTSKGINDTNAWLETIITHYDNHRWLQTDAGLGELAYMSFPMTINWNEPDIRPALVDTESLFFGVIIQLTIPMSETT